MSNTAAPIVFLVIPCQPRLLASTIKPSTYDSSSVASPLQIPLHPSSLLSAPSMKSASFYLKTRQRIIKDMKTISRTFLLQAQTLILAVSYLDTLCLNALNCTSSDYNAMKSLGLFCLILAAKFNEVGAQGVALEKECKHVVSADFKSDEIYILSKLNYELAVRTPLDMIREIMVLGFLFRDERVNTKKMEFVYAQMEQMVLAFVESKYYVELTKDEVVFALIGFVRESLCLKAFSSTFVAMYGIQEVCEKYENAVKKVKNVLRVKHGSKKKKKKGKGNDFINVQN